MSLIRARAQMLYKNSMHGTVRKVSTGVIGYKGIVRLGRRTRAFWSMDPQRAAGEARHAELDIARATNRAVQEMVQKWVKDHDYDVDSLCAAGIEIRFDFGQAPGSGEDCVNVVAEMYAVTTGHRTYPEGIGPLPFGRRVGDDGDVF